MIVFASCEDNQIERNWNRLEGNWKVQRAWFREDTKQVFRDNNSRDDWRVSFYADSTFMFFLENDTLKGRYHTSLTQVRLVFTGPSISPDNNVLWYYVTVNRNSIEATEMTETGEFEYFWSREK